MTIYYSYQTGTTDGRQGDGREETTMTNGARDADASRAQVCFFKINSLSFKFTNNYLQYTTPTKRERERQQQHTHTTNTTTTTTDDVDKLGSRRRHVSRPWYIFFFLSFFFTNNFIIIYRYTTCSTGTNATATFLNDNDDQHGPIK
jgi:hypothetical protein